MPYPMSVPKAKHDLTFAHPLPEYSHSLVEAMGITSSTELFRRLEEPLDPGKYHSSVAVYSYSDAPDYPAPLSRSLHVLGFADTSISLVRRILNHDGIPDCLHKCTIAVKLADSKHMPLLEPRHKENSSSFSQLMKQLRRDEAVAIVGKDKLGRFVILAPMTVDSFPQDKDDPSTILPEDCAAYCFVGSTKEVLEYLASEVPHSATDNMASSGNGLWQPPGTSDHAAQENTFAAPWETDVGTTTSDTYAWEAPVHDKSDGSWNSLGGKRSFEAMNGSYGSSSPTKQKQESYHADSGAAAADSFYSGLTRSLDTRADSYLYHMRAFNGWVKATQIQELDPVIMKNGKPQVRTPLRVLDLACGKGGDLTKWTLHTRGMKWYVGIDVARGSLKDAAIRAREMRKKNKLSQAIFTVADLGADVPGRKKSPSHQQMQKLLTWSLTDEPENESAPPEFRMIRGGGISETDRFDVVSIQFAIHYMMSSRERARRFFHTVSELLEVGGNLICTTIDARVVIEHLMDLGHNYHFQDEKEPEFSQAVVEAGKGACKIRFEADMVKKIVTSMCEGTSAEEDLFGLQYTFTLVEGSDHAAGVGDAVNLPEWLTPLPVLQALAHEAGLELEYAQNFHEFYENRNDPSSNPAAHLALYNMKVLNRDGTISADEWSISRLYAAIKFRKVRDSCMHLEETETMDDSDVEPTEEQARPIELDAAVAQKMLPMAMIKAKRVAGDDVWNTLSSEEKKHLTQIQLQIMLQEKR